MWYSCAIAAVASLESFPIADGTTLASGVRLEPVPSWVKDNQAIKDLSWQDRERIKQAEIGFAIEYEAEALGSPDPNSTLEPPPSIQRVAVEKFVLASIALWLVRPSMLTFGPVLHFGRSGDPSSIRQVSINEPILIPAGEEENALSLDDVGEAGRLLERLLLLNRKGPVWTAVWTLFPALTERTWVVRYLLEWVTVEALLGPESPNETTFRLSQRIGLFVGATKPEKLELFRKAKEGYKWRSVVVHGSQPSKLGGDGSLELSKGLEDILRRALRKVLLTPGLAEIFECSEREKHLDELAFT